MTRANTDAKAKDTVYIAALPHNSTVRCAGARARQSWRCSLQRVAASGQSPDFALPYWSVLSTNSSSNSCTLPANAAAVVTTDLHSPLLRLFSGSRHPGVVCNSRCMQQVEHQANQRFDQIFADIFLAGAEQLAG